MGSSYFFGSEESGLPKRPVFLELGLDRKLRSFFGSAEFDAADLAVKRPPVWGAGGGFPKSDDFAPDAGPLLKRDGLLV